MKKKEKLYRKKVYDNNKKNHMMHNIVNVFTKSTTNECRENNKTVVKLAHKTVRRLEHKYILFS